MMQILRMLGNVFFALLDISVGIFTVFIAEIMSRQTFDLYDYIVGSFLAVAPDTDVLYMYARKGRIYTNHHEFITHRPIVVMPICILACWIIGGKIWGLIVGICILWHYIHDTEDLLGGGIALFWPFSKKYHSFKRTIDPKQSSMSVEHNLALETQIFSPSKKVITESAMASILLVIVISNKITIAAGIAVVIIIWLSLFFVWIIFSSKPWLT